MAWLMPRLFMQSRLTVSVQAETPFARLAAPRRRRVVGALIHPLDFAARERVVEKSFHGFPSQTALHQGPGLMHHVIRGHQFPACLLRTFKNGERLRMKPIRAVETGVETGEVSTNTVFMRSDRTSLCRGA